MPSSSPPVEFAEALLKLKIRTGQGYRGLAGRLYISKATLHRYCVGKALPPEFSMVKRLARLYGARSTEVDDLYRLWLRAKLETRQTWQ